MPTQRSRNGVTTYRSYPAQLGRAVCVVGVPLMLAMAVFVPVGYPSPAVDVVFDTFAVGIALGISHILLTALKVSPDQIRVVNWFRSHTFAVSDVEQFAMSRNMRPSGLLNLLNYGDNNHVLLVTTEGRVVNVAALVLGNTDWDREGVEKLVSSLNSSLTTTTSPPA